MIQEKGEGLDARIYEDKETGRQGNTETGIIKI
jgi:hypothetical protein